MTRELVDQEHEAVADLIGVAVAKRTAQLQGHPGTADQSAFKATREVILLILQDPSMDALTDFLTMEESMLQ